MPASKQRKTAKRRRAWDDNPEWTAEDFRRARPMAEVFPELVEAIKRARGRPKLATPKQQVTLRLDARALAAFRATGKGWQTRINEAVKKAAPKRAKR